MSSRILSIVLTVAMVLTSVPPATAQEMIYRYKHPVNYTPPATPDAPLEEIGIGNDIEAYYVAIVGRDFSKTIPVKTKDVSEWRVEEGDRIPGLELDTASGMYAGEATSPGKSSQLLYGYDVNGTRIARARLHFTVFEAKGVEVGFDYRAYTGEYFYSNLPTPEGVEVDRWVAAHDWSPAGMMTVGHSFQGTPGEPGSWDLVYVGLDYMDRQVAFATGTFEALEHPQVGDIETPQVRNRQAGEVFSGQPEVIKSVGQLVYTLVPTGDRPPGLEFDSLTGRIGGVFDDFDTSASFRIEVRDMAGGKPYLTEEFTLATLPAELDLSDVKVPYSIVGTAFGPMFLSSTYTFPGMEWSIDQGELPEGIDFVYHADSDRWALEGTFLKKQSLRGIVLKASAPGVEAEYSSPFDWHVGEQNLNPRTEDFKGRTGEAIATAGVSITNNGSETYEFEVFELPEGFSFDKMTGVISKADGLAEPATVSALVRAVVQTADGPDPRSGYVAQTISVRKPLKIAYKPEADGYTRYLSAQLYPETDYSAAFKYPKFKLVQGTLPGEWLKFYENGGRFHITEDAVAGIYGPFKVEIDDGQATKTSEEFTIEVTERKLPAPKLLFSGIQRFVPNRETRLVWADNLYYYKKPGGSYRFELDASSAPLPPGMTLREDGELMGTTSAAVGTVFPGIIIKATDKVGDDPEVSGVNKVAFELTIVEPEEPRAVEGSFDFAFTWPRGVPLSIALPHLRYALGKVTYTVEGATVGDLAITDSTISGTVPEEGEYALVYKVEDELNRGAVGTISLKITPQMSVSDTVLEWTANKSTWFEEKPAVKNGVAPLVFTLDASSQIPEGWSFSWSDGTVSGMPRAEEADPRRLLIHVTDKAGVRRKVEIDLSLKAPKPFNFSYGSTPRTLFVGEQTGLPILPSVTNGTAPFTYELVGDTVPGLSLEARTTADAETVAGRLRGTPTTPGVYTLRVTATDANRLRPVKFDPQTETYVSNDPVETEVLVGYSGEISFKEQTLRHRAGTSFEQALSYSRAIAPLTFSSADPEAPLPSGWYLDAPTGVLKATAPAAGETSSFSATLSDNPRFARDPQTANVSVVGVPPLELEVPPSMPVQQYREKSFSVLRSANVIGDGNPATRDANFSPDPATPFPDWLSVDAATGAVTATKPPLPGEFGPFRIVLSDSYGDSVPSNGFTVKVGERDALTLAYASPVTFHQYADRTEAPSTYENAADGEVRWEVSPALPDGLALVDGSIVATKPLSAVAAQTYRITARDRTNYELNDPRGTAFADVTIGVERRPELSLSYSAESFEITQYRKDETLSATLGGELAVPGNTLEWSVDPLPPEGIVFDKGVFKGNGAMLPLDAVPYKVTVTDSTFRDHGDSRGKSEFTLDVSVKARPQLVVEYPASEFPQYGTASASPSKTEHDDGDLAFTEIDPLPQGFSLDRATGTVTADGPTSTLANGVFRIEVTDNAFREFDDPKGRTEASIDISVLRRGQIEATPVAEPVAMEQWKDTKHAVVASAPTPAFGDLVYAIVDGAPVGLVLEGDRIGGEISAAPGTYTVTMSVSDATYSDRGDSRGYDEFQVTVEVSERPAMTATMGDLPIKLVQYSEEPKAVTFAERRGTASYTVVPDLPEGLRFDGERLVGRPLTPAAEQVYAVSVTDGKGGDAEFSVILSVERRPQMDLDYGRPDGVTFVQFMRDPAVVPGKPAFANGTVEYSVSPQPPACLLFDTSTGGFKSECDTVLDAVAYTVIATDATHREFGDNRGRDTYGLIVSVRKRDPITVSYPDYDAGLSTFGFRRFGDRTVYPEVKNPVGVTYEFTDIDPPLPDGLSFDRATGAIMADSDAVIPSNFYSFRVTDAKEGDTPVSLVIGVDDRKPLAFKGPFEVPVLLNSAYPGFRPALVDVIGETSVIEIEDASKLPPGLSFDADTGTVSGTMGQAGYGDYEVRFRASDEFDGTTGWRSFSFKVREDTTPVSVSYSAPPATRVGHRIEIAAPAVEYAVGTVSYSAPDLPALGLSLDPATGAISGTAAIDFDTTVEITATDGLGRKAIASVSIVARPAPVITVPGTIPGLFNREIVPDVQPDAARTSGTENWTVKSGVLPPGLTLDPATGAFLGKPEKIGTFGPVVLTLTDDLPGSFDSAPVMFSFEMNEDPIEMVSPIILTKVGFPVETAPAVYDNNYGPARFTSTELAGLGLSVHPDTGVISGQVASPFDGNPNVVVSDDTIRRTTVPVTLKVLPRMRLVAPTTVTATALDPMTPASVTRSYVAGSAVWNDVDPASLPPGVTFNTSTGRFEGTPAKVGTWGPVTVTATDTFGSDLTDTATSNDIMIEVKKGAIYINLLAGDLGTATKRSPYSFDFRPFLDPESQGMDPSQIVWSAQGLPDGLVVDDKGLVTGVPTTPGDYEVVVTGSYGTKSASRTYRLAVVLPVIDLVFDAAVLEDGVRKTSSTDPVYGYDFKDLITATGFAPEDVVIEMVSGTIPTGLSVVDGVISGTPTVSGDFQFTLKASFDHGTEHIDRSRTFDLTIKEPVYIELVQAALPGGTKRADYSFDFKSLLHPDTKGVAPEAITFKKASGTTPPGLTLYPTGVLRGIPTSSGKYDFEITASGEGISFPMTYSIEVVLPATSLSMANKTLPDGIVTEAIADVDLDLLASVNGFPKSSLVYQIVTNPADLGASLTATGRAIKATPKKEGTYTLRVRASFTSGTEYLEAFSDITITVKPYLKTFWRFKSIKARSTNLRGYAYEVVLSDKSNTNLYSKVKSIVSGPPVLMNGITKCTYAWDQEYDCIGSGYLNNGESLVVEYKVPVFVNSATVYAGWGTSGTPLLNEVMVQSSNDGIIWKDEFGSSSCGNCTFSR